MNEITKDIDNLFEELKNIDCYKNCLLAKNKLEKNKEIVSLIEEIKRLQKICTNNKDDFLENKIKDLYKSLECYPVYQSYLIYKEQLNDELFMIKEQFEKYFEEILKL